MTGVLDWLDNVTTQVGSIAGKAVDVVGNVSVAQADRTAKAQTDPRAVSAVPVASLQAGPMNLNGVLPWVALGVAVLVVGVLILRSK